MLTDKEIFDAVNEAPLGRTGETTVISVGRAIEAKVLEKLGNDAARYDFIRSRQNTAFDLANAIGVYDAELDALIDAARGAA